MAPSTVQSLDSNTAPCGGPDHRLRLSLQHLQYAQTSTKDPSHSQAHSFPWTRGQLAIHFNLFIATLTFRYPPLSPAHNHLLFPLLYLPTLYSRHNSAGPSAHHQRSWLDHGWSLVEDCPPQS